MRDGFAEELAQLKPLTDQLFVLGNTPKLPREPGVCMSQGGDVTLQDCLFKRGPVMHSIQMDFKAAARDQGVAFVNASPWFCYRLMCPPVIGSTIAMRDSEHMTPEYAVELAEPLPASSAWHGLTGPITARGVVPNGSPQAGDHAPQEIIRVVVHPEALRVTGVTGGISALGPRNRLPDRKISSCSTVSLPLSARLQRAGSPPVCSC